jgi:hypothetical protein
MLVPFENLFALMGSPGGYSKSRKKQLDLVELAFLKHRLRQGVRNSNLESKEYELRSRIASANHEGIFIGAR